MTLQDWLDRQHSTLPRPVRGGSPASRNGMLTDREFGQMLADRTLGISAASQQQVYNWRAGMYMPRSPWDLRIVEVTRGQVTIEDMRRVWLERRNRG